jgi:hypothetical protein
VGWGFGVGVGVGGWSCGWGDGAGIWGLVGGGWRWGVLSGATRDQVEKETSCLGSMRELSVKAESSEWFDLGDALLQSGRPFRSSSGNSIFVKIPDGQDV